MVRADKDPVISRKREYEPSVEQLKRLDVLKRLTEVLEREHVRYSILGGYGLDGLHGELTRDHADLDLLTDEAGAGKARELLGQMGFALERTKKSGVEVYRHLVGDTMLEYAHMGFLKTLTTESEEVFLPQRPNASLEGFSFRSATLEGHEIIKQTQLARAKEQGWKPYPHTETQAALMQKIKDAQKKES